MQDDVRILARVDPPSFEDANSEDEGENELILLKQGATHIAVDGVGEVVVQCVDPLLQLLGVLTVSNGLHRGTQDRDGVMTLHHQLDVINVAK